MTNDDPDDSSSEFYPFGRRPGRPDHPDFWAAIDVVLKLDGDTIESDRSYPDIVGEVVDPTSLQYVAEQRMVRGMNVMGLDLPTQVRVLVVATYMEAFVAGALYQQRKES